MLFGGACLLLLLSGAHASGWRWPDGAGAASVRIDTKVRFVDDDSRRPNKVQADEIKPPVETEGFYNRPAAGAGSGRYSVQSEPHAQRLTEHDRARPQYSDGTLDSVQYCKCVTSSASSCHTHTNSEKACPSGKNLCCYRRTNRNPHGSDLGIFSELEDERPMLLPSHERRPGPFSDPEEMSHDLIGAIKPSAATVYQSGGAYRGLLFGPEGPTGIIGPVHQENRILAGPSGPSGLIGPGMNNPDLLVGPEGPSGIIGPTHRDNRYPVPVSNQRNPGVLVGPGGPTGIIGINPSNNRMGHNQRNPGILVGPDGPTGVIGVPSDNRMGHNQRNPAVLVGPEGPTGVIGPNDHENSVHAGPNRSNKFNQGVLVGPNGPTGVIGPGNRDDRDFTGPPSYIRPDQRHPGVLVGPEGPTGHIGVPDQHEPWVLIGPGGPTGGIGPDHKKGVHTNQGAESAQVLVGPSGPTGIIGPGGRRGRWQTGPGILVGPGGPSGIIGPGQRLLVGPSGPTGRLGPPRRPMSPRGYGQYGF